MMVWEALDGVGMSGSLPDVLQMVKFLQDFRVCVELLQHIMKRVPHVSMSILKDIDCGNPLVFKWTRTCYANLDLVGGRGNEKISLTK